MKERIEESPPGGEPQEELEPSYLEEQLAKSRGQLLIYAADLAKSFAAGQRKTKELEEKHRRLTALYEVSRALNSVLDLERVLNLAMDAVMGVTGAERGFAMLLDSKSDEWVLTLARQIDHQEIESPSFHTNREAIEKVIATHTPVVATDVRGGGDLMVQTNGIGDTPRSTLCVPLMIRKQLTGVIYVDNQVQKGAFTEQDLDFLIAFADQAAIAVENARLYEKVTARMREAMALYRVSTRLMRTLNLDQLLEDILEVLQRAFGYLNCALLLVDQDAGEMYIKAACGYPPEIMAAGRIKIGQGGIAGWVAANKAALNVPDVTRDPRYVKWMGETRSEIAVPMLVGDKVIGVLEAQSPEVSAFDEDDLRVLSSVAAQAAIAFERVRLYEETQQKMTEIATMKNYMDNIFASIASGVITTDTEGRITTFNRAAEDILGIPSDQAVGRLYHEVLDFFKETPFPSLVEEAKTFERPHLASEVELQLPQRGKVSLNLDVSTLKDQAGKPLGVAIVIDDLTEEKRLEAEREWEEREKQRIRRLFQRYVAPKVVERLIEGIEQVALGGKRQVVTILFADIRGFTSFSEARRPEELVEILNHHLSLAAQAVLEQEGTLDKFMGDAVMALFNAPLPQPDHTLRAVQAALAMQQAIAAYHGELDSEAQLSFGVGINVGEAVVGNVGTAELMNYTAIGDAVNLAKGLQENAEGGQILLSQSAHQAVKEHVRVRALEPIKVKGRSGIEPAYEVVGLKERSRDARSIASDTASHVRGVEALTGTA
jgi:adenylate cyclase